jgi:hypothetical protein
MSTAAATNYFELDFEPDLYKGELNLETSNLEGLGMYRKGKLILIGCISSQSRAFEGPAVIYDFSQEAQTATVFMGQLKGGLKHGVGVMQRAKLTMQQIER